MNNINVDNKTITINANNFILVSGRGSSNSTSAKIVKTVRDGKSCIKISGNNNRITGLIIKGPDQSTQSAAGANVGIEAVGTNMVIDNCEIYGWPNMGIRFGDPALIFQVDYITNTYSPVGKTSTANIHHNFIHHNTQDGTGYGVGVYGNTNTTIENNIFDYHRHSISSQGTKFTSFHVSNNLFKANGSSTAIDSHGYMDILGQIYDHHQNDLYIPYQSYLPNLCISNMFSTLNYASQSITITNNTFVFKGERYGVSAAYYNFSIDISGIPHQSCIISNNFFAGNSNRTIRQIFAWPDGGIVTCQNYRINSF